MFFGRQRNEEPIEYNSRINFVGYADKKYWHFVVPYIFSNLFWDDNASAEVLVHDYGNYIKKHASSIKFLERNYPGRFEIVPIPNYLSSNRIIPNSKRFLYLPQIDSELTYYGDIDIFCLDQLVYSFHRQNIENLGGIVSNVQRSGKKDQRLSGLNCVVTEKYNRCFGIDKITKVIDLLHSESELGKKLKNSDEVLLHYIVSEFVGDSLPFSDDAVRPGHGYHFSPNRVPVRTDRNQLDWGLRSLEYTNNYLQMFSSEIFAEFIKSVSSTPFYRLICEINLALKENRVFDPMQTTFSLTRYRIDRNDLFTK